MGNVTLKSTIQSLFQSKKNVEIYASGNFYVFRIADSNDGFIFYDRENDIQSEILLEFGNLVKSKTFCIPRSSLYKSDIDFQETHLLNAMTEITKLSSNCSRCKKEAIYSFQKRVLIDNRPHNYLCKPCFKKLKERKYF